MYPEALTGWLVRRLVPVLWQERIESGFRRLLTSAWRPVFFAIPTCIPLFFMQRGTLDVNITFLVQPRNMAIYAIFFAFGWLLYGQSDRLTGFQRAAWTQVNHDMLRAWEDRPVDNVEAARARKLARLKVLHGYWMFGCSAVKFREAATLTKPGSRPRGSAAYRNARLRGPCTRWSCSNTGPGCPR